MRAPVPSSSWLNRTSLGETALNSFTGTLTSPKLMAPLQMALGIGLVSHLSHDLFRVDIGALALVGRVAEDPDARPLGELHLDDELLGEVVLDLEPLAGAHAGLVVGVEPLGHHTLQAGGAGGVEQGAPLAGMGGRGVPG